MTDSFNNPWLRWHQNFEEYPSHLHDIDDISMHTTDNFERTKKYLAKGKDVMGTSSVVPREDNDATSSSYDIQGESALSNPPNPN